MKFNDSAKFNSIRFPNQHWWLIDCWVEVEVWFWFGWLDRLRLYQNGPVWSLDAIFVFNTWCRDANFYLTLVMTAINFIYIAPRYKPRGRFIWFLDAIFLFNNKSRDASFYFTLVVTAIYLINTSPRFKPCGRFVGVLVPNPGGGWRIPKSCIM